MIDQPNSSPRGRVWKDDADIWWVQLDGATEIASADLEILFESARASVTGRSLVLIDRRASYEMSFPALRYASAVGAEHFAAVAFLTRPGMPADVAAYIAEVFYPTLPTGVFTKEEAAVAWLTRFRPSDE